MWCSFDRLQRTRTSTSSRCNILDTLVRRLAYEFLQLPLEDKQILVEKLLVF